jgi:hypothetical protein
MHEFSDCPSAFSGVDASDVSSLAGVVQVMFVHLLGCMDAGDVCALAGVSAGDVCSLAGVDAGDVCSLAGAIVLTSLGRFNINSCPFRLYPHFSAQ